MRKRPLLKKAAKRTYHHGNLQPALVDAGLRIVASRGVAALSLRAVARRARVSHAAPYHHFRSKAELLAAVAAAGFDRLVETIRAEAGRVQRDDPLDRLRAVGRGYLGFAVTHPSIFRLMFRPELTRPAQHPRLREAEARAFGTLMETLIACQEVGRLPKADPRLPAALAWSAVHGLAMLHLDGVLAETPIGQVRFETLSAEVNEAIVTGLRAHPWS